MRRLNRVLPRLGPEKIKTYQLLAPVSTHRRPATCTEVECDGTRFGWRTTVDESGMLGQSQAHYIRRESGRSFVESRDEMGLTVFTFLAGQSCFAGHTVPLEREPIFLVKDGDFRGNPRGTRPRVHDRPEHWVEDFSEHQDGISKLINGG